MTQTVNCDPFRDISELVRLVDRFESCNLPMEQWNHRAHLAVCAWYLIHFSESQATERMISGIRRYNRANRIRVTPTGGYHETMTLFWLAVVSAYMSRNKARRVLTRVNGLVSEYGNRRRLHAEYYSERRLWSEQARNCWVAPDLKPLPANASHIAESRYSNCR